MIQLLSLVVAATILGIAVVIAFQGRYGVASLYAFAAMMWLWAAMKSDRMP